MNPLYKIVAALAIGCFLAIAFAQTYHAGYMAGSWQAYADGWSDAHCGKGHSCEAGEE